MFKSVVISQKWRPHCELNLKNACIQYAILESVVSSSWALMERLRYWIQP